MLEVKQVFIKNYLLLLHIMLFLVHFNSYEIIRSQSLKVSNSYQNSEVKSIKKLLVVRVPSSFLLYYEIA